MDRDQATARAPFTLTPMLGIKVKASAIILTPYRSQALLRSHSRFIKAAYTPTKTDIPSQINCFVSKSCAPLTAPALKSITNPRVVVRVQLQLNKWKPNYLISLMIDPIFFPSFLFHTLQNILIEGLSGASINGLSSVVPLKKSCKLSLLDSPSSSASVIVPGLVTGAGDSGIEA